MSDFEPVRMPFSPEQLEELAEVMNSPDWYMNGRLMNEGDYNYYTPWLLLDYCLFDLETTDLLFEDEQEKTIKDTFHIVQYYGERYRNRVRDKGTAYNQLIDPGTPIDPYLTEKVHGIGDTDVLGKPSFSEVWPNIVAQFDGADGIVAYNGDGFDIPGLVTECVRAGIPYGKYEPIINRPHLNLLVWEKERTGINRKNKLSDLAKRFGVKMMGLVEHGRESLHDARVDVAAMSGLIEVMSSEADMPFTLGKLVELQAKYTERQEAYQRKRRAKKKSKTKTKKKESK